MFNMTWSEWAAGGKHVVSYAAGAATVAAAWGLISQGDSTSIVQNLNLLMHGLGEVVTAVTMLATTAASIWAGLKAIRNSSPESQMKSVVTNLTEQQVAKAAGAVDDPAGRKKLISAVADMPEVKQVVTDEQTALQTLSPKVVS